MDYLFRPLVLFVSLLLSCTAWAQGQDSTAGERYLLVMAEMLPGDYDNANQHYFDKRRKLDEADRHPRIHSSISRLLAPAFEQPAFLWVDIIKSDKGQTETRRIVTLAANGAGDEVLMRQYSGAAGMLSYDKLTALTPADLVYTKGCDFHFKRRAGQFRGSQMPQDCGDASLSIELSETGLWFDIPGYAVNEPFWLERARTFHCYADIPGVGGGRDIPFERYDDFTLHDKGGAHWFITRGEKQRNIGLVLQSVTWHVLNEKNGNFNRDSLVLYTMEKMPDGTIKDHGYAFTEPEAKRIGNNMKWMLVNCAITPRNQARPEM